MIKKTLLIVCFTLILLIIVPITTVAQTDSDGDGIADTEDHCPTEPGPAENNGCPEVQPQPPSDSDGDGVPDTEDHCPTEPGPAENNGCPEVQPQPPSDSDGDGMPDTNDRCPAEPGIAANNGCPEVQSQPPSDSDGDGVPDTNDRCPAEPGIAANNGCPEVQSQPPSDSDGDGVPDTNDRCPAEPGPIENNGCPEVQPQPPSDSDGDGVPDTDDRCPGRVGSYYGCPLPSLPDQGRCVLATIGADRVNIRIYPHLDAEVVDKLAPLEVVPVLGVYQTPAIIVQGGDSIIVQRRDPIIVQGRDSIIVQGGDSIIVQRENPIIVQSRNSNNPIETWYRIAKGWVSGEVVRLGGICNQLPAPTSPPTDNNACQIDPYSPLTAIDPSTTYFTWTPVDNPDLAWYQLNLYDAATQQWVGGFGKGINEPFGNMDTSPSTIGYGPEFEWHVLAYSTSGAVLCESNPKTIIRSTVPIVTYPSLQSCEGFAGITPFDQLGTMHTHFEWAHIPDAAYYILRLYDAENVHNYADSNTFIDIPTDSASIGDGPWTWQVEAFTLGHESLCTTDLYSVTRAELDDIGAPVGDVEVDCENFVGLLPSENSIISDLPHEVTFTWSSAAVANINYYIRVYHQEGGSSIGSPTLGDTTINLFVDSTSSLGPGVEYYWDVAAYSADNPGGYGGYETALCVTPPMHYILEPAQLDDSSDQPPTRLDPSQPRTESDFPPILIDIDLSDLCQDFIMVAFEDSPTWSQFWWIPLSWADGYAINIYDDSMQWLNTYKVSVGTQFLVVDLGLGSQQNFWFDVDALSAAGNALCTMNPYFVERSFGSPLGEISFDPNITIKPEGCDAFEAISPLEQFENSKPNDPAGNSWFEWTKVPDAYGYELHIYNSNGDWVNGTHVNGYPQYDNNPTISFPTSNLIIGEGDNFSWDVVAFDNQGNIICVIAPPIEVTRPSSE